MAYSDSQYTGTIRPAQPFSADRDAEVLRKAMKGLGTDEKAIIDVLAYRVNSQRQEIKTMFKTMYGKDLIKELKSELGGKLEDVVLALLTPPIEYDASRVKHALDGLGTDENVLIEILCTRDNKQILDIKDAYKKLYKKDMEKEISKDVSGHFGRLMISMSTGARMEGQSPDPARAKEDAQALYKAGAARLGTDESTFNRIFASQSYEQLRLVFAEYQALAGKPIEKAVKSEMSGDIEKGMLTVVQCVQSRPAYFAHRLHSSMAGAGTKDQNLIRLVVTRAEVDMVQIKHEFQKLYGKSLESFIKDDCSGDYKRILIAVVSDK